MRTILELAGVAVALLGADAASAAFQPRANSAPPPLQIDTRLSAPAGGCMPGYAQDPKAVAAAEAPFVGDPAAQERAIAMVPCVRVDAASTAGVHPSSSRAIPKPPH
jgi:hypothetical protein